MGETATISQFLTFTLASETYALEVSHVREVLEMTRITPLPQTPGYMRGVINVRGSVVPVVDLGLKMGMPGAGESIDTCVVVLDVPGKDGPVMVGALVDSVQEVVDFASENIEPPPSFGTTVQTGFLKGIGKREERFVMILDIGTIFEGEEIGLPAGAEAAPAIG